MGNPTPHLHSHHHHTARKRDVALVLLINFLASIAFSIVLPSLWSFIHELHGSKSLVGYAIAGVFGVRR